MAGGTQTTYTTTEPWEAQQDYLETGFGRTEDAYQAGDFAPAFYGAPGTMDSQAQAWDQSGRMIAPGLLGFDPNTRDAMGRSYNYAMGPRASGMMHQAETGFVNQFPYAQSAMNYGLGSSMMPSGPEGYAGMLPFDQGQYGQMLRGDVDYDSGPFGAMADVYRQEFEDQVSQGLANVRQGQVLYQPGGGSRGDIFSAQVANAGQKALAQNLAGLYGGAYQQAQAGRLPAAQMGLGQQQFGMGHGLQGGQLGLGAGGLSQQAAQQAGQLGLGAGGLETQAGRLSVDAARAGGELGLGAGNLATKSAQMGGQLGLGALDRYQGIMDQPLKMYGAAGKVGEQQRSMQQEQINRAMAKHNFEQNAAQNNLNQYLSQVGGNFGSQNTQSAGGMNNMANLMMMFKILKDGLN